MAEKTATAAPATPTSALAGAEIAPLPALAPEDVEFAEAVLDAALVEAVLDEVGAEVPAALPLVVPAAGELGALAAPLICALTSAVNVPVIPLMLKASH